MSVKEQQKIKCPSCNVEISIDDVLTQQIEEKIKSGLASEQKVKEAEFKKQENELNQKKLEVEEARKTFDISVAQKVNKQVGKEKIELWKKARTEANKEKEAEKKLLEEQLKEKDEKLSVANEQVMQTQKDKQVFEEEKKNFELEKIRQIEAERKKIETNVLAKAKEQSESERKILEAQLADKDTRLKEANEKELEIRKEKNRLEEEKKNFELEKQRQMDEERKKIEEDAGKKAAEVEKYKITQLEKKLSDAIKVNEEQKRKMEQGSQQAQGEVLELELEELLKQKFIYDEITPVPKGVCGADIIQKIVSRSGKNCGQIVWEVKKTKAWSEGWIQKLKDDQRIVKAELAVLVSSVLPEGIKGFAFRDGIWVCDIKLAIALASSLRITLEEVAREKAKAVGKNEKVEILYSYLTGVEFKQRIEAIVEAFTGMQDGLNREKKAYQKIWAEREKQIQKVINNTVGMYGDLSGLVTLPQIKTLELEEGKDNLDPKIKS